MLLDVRKLLLKEMIKIFQLVRLLLSIHKYLTVKNKMKYCFELLEKCLFILILTMPLTHVAMASDRTKYVSLNNH